MNAGDGLGASTSPLGSPLGDRYEVIRELGRGGFGQTYLAKDLHRYNEPCVLKEFLPQVEDKATLNKAKELFEREANVLYQLGHKQIPEFRQLLEVTSEAGGRLFLVQDYVEGPTYQALLQDRQQFGGQFTETEVTQLLYQLLPVLSYIHGLGLVHRDISPDNLILRQSDGLPVLVDFGSVKEITAAVRSQLAIAGAGPTPTRIGKVGYVPPEQLSSGEADPASDLYSLAATMLVLANGREPQVLHDPYQSTWTGYEAVSPKLGRILAKMLDSNPSERFPTAEAVLTALRSVQRSVQRSDDTVSRTPVEDLNVVAGAIYPPVDAARSEESALMDSEIVDDDDETATVMAAPGAAIDEPTEAERELEESSDVYEPDLESEVQSRTFKRPDSRSALIALLVVLGVVATLLLFSLVRFLNRPSNDTPQPQATDQTQPYSSEEAARKQEIERRRQGLGIDQGYFARLVNQLFYQDYPSLRNSGPDGGPKPLTTAPEDEPLRLRWDNIALDLLDTLETNFSQGSLSALGSYSEDSRSRWQSQVAQVNVGTRSLYDLVDAKFFQLFPGQSGQDFINQPVGQIYYALADDRARSIESGALREEVQFASGAFRQDVSGTIGPGEGRVYTMRLSAGQLLRLSLSAPAESTLLSLYLPAPTDDNPFVLADSEDITWSGAVTQSGYYEVVVVNRAAESITYQLAVSVDNVTSPPPDDDEAAADSPDSDDDAETPDEEAATPEPFIEQPDEDNTP